MTGQLPDWVTAGKETRKLFDWLEYGKDSISLFSNRFFMKVTAGNCVLIYTEDAGQTERTERFHSSRLCGIYRKTDHTLYEAGPALYQAIGIPMEFCFPDKDMIQKELEEKVTISGREQMQQEWDQLVQNAGFTREELIPAIDRAQIRMTARRYFQMGKRAKHIVYLPRFSFAALQWELPDEVLLQYLDDEAAAVGAVTANWLMKSLAEISKKRIFYGCVREEMAEMEKTGYARGNGAFYTQDAEQKSA